MRLWISGAGETRYEQDLPSCCHGEAKWHGTEEDWCFECAVCGAAWLSPLPVEPEFDAFTYHVPDETEGAA